MRKLLAFASVIMLTACCTPEHSTYFYFDQGDVVKIKLHKKEYMIEDTITVDNEAAYILVDSNGNKITEKEYKLQLLH